MASVLGRQEVGEIVADLRRDSFADGRATAEGFAREVKYNLQRPAANAGNDPVASRIVVALDRNPDLQKFAFPRCIFPPMFNRYEVGMHYGRHVDAGMMGGLAGLRTDFAVTVFLSAPDSYDGGELVIDTHVGEQAIKLDAGEAIIYPGNTIHHVAPVTRGVRLAAVTWVQSAVRDPRLRTVLQDLQDAMAQADGAQDKDMSLRLTKTYQDIVRYAVDA